IVRQLHLDAPKPANNSIVGNVKSAAKTTIQHLRAWIVFGTYKQTDRFTQAVDDVQSGLSAHQVGTSYVLELTAGADTPQGALNIANAAADKLVKVGEQTFQVDAAAYQRHLT